VLSAPAPARVWRVSKKRKLCVKKRERKGGKRKGKDEGTKKVVAGHLDLHY